MLGEDSRLLAGTGAKEGIETKEGVETKEGIAGASRSMRRAQIIATALCFAGIAAAAGVLSITSSGRGSDGDDERGASDGSDDALGGRGGVTPSATKSPDADDGDGDGTNTGKTLPTPSADYADCGDFADTVYQTSRGGGICQAWTEDYDCDFFFCSHCMFAGYCDGTCDYCEPSLAPTPQPSRVPFPAPTVPPSAKPSIFCDSSCTDAAETTYGAGACSTFFAMGYDCDTFFCESCGLAGDCDASCGNCVACVTPSPTPAPSTSMPSYEPSTPPSSTASTDTDAVRRQRRLGGGTRGGAAGVTAGAVVAGAVTPADAVEAAGGEEFVRAQLRALALAARAKSLELKARKHSKAAPDLAAPWPHGRGKSRW